MNELLVVFLCLLIGMYQKLCGENFDCLNIVELDRNLEIRIACLMGIAWKMQPAA